MIPPTEAAALRQTVASVPCIRTMLETQRLVQLYSELQHHSTVLHAYHAGDGIIELLGGLC